MLDRLVSSLQLSLKEFQRKMFYTLALIRKEAAEDRKTFQQANQQSIPEVITEPGKAEGLVYYLAYTAMIADLASRYEWSSILEFDRKYRELQAEHGFLWGTQHAHPERHTLIHKRGKSQGSLNLSAPSSTIMGPASMARAANLGTSQVQQGI